MKVRLLLFVVIVLMVACSLFYKVNEKYVHHGRRGLDSVLFVIHPNYLGYENCDGIARKCENCIDGNCGKPVLLVDVNFNYISVNTSGNSTPKYSVSPSGQYVLLSDWFGLHRVNRGIVDMSIRHSDYGSLVRGVAINDGGDYVAMRHLGSIRIDDRSGFGSAIQYLKDGKPYYYNKIIDGYMISCDDSAYLLSFGDEDEVNRSIVAYKYDWASHVWLELSGKGDALYRPVHAHMCDGDSFYYLRSGEGVFEMGRWDESTGFNDYATYDFIDARAASGSSYLTFKENNLYLIDDDDILKYVPPTGGRVVELWRISDVISSVDLTNSHVYYMGKSSLIVIGRSDRSGNWIAVSIDLLSGEIQEERYLPLLDEIYSDSMLGDLTITDMDRFMEWMRTNPPVTE